MTVRNVTKSPAAMEDMLIKAGQHQQSRGRVNGVFIPVYCYSKADLEQVDPSKCGIAELDGMLYAYSSQGGAIGSVFGGGWLRVNKDAKAWADSIGKTVAIGSFESGATVEPGQLLYYKAEYAFYESRSTVQVIVPAGSNPTVGSWLLRSNDSLYELIPDLPAVIAQRPSFNALPRLLATLGSYNEATQLPVNIVGLGSSVGVGASLPDPSTQAPVNYFAAKVKAALDVGDIFNFATYNKSVNGSTISEYSVPLEEAVSAGHTPKVLVLAYGMNDAGVAIFNAGQTYPAIYTNAVAMIQRARDLGSDVVILTTPHHKCSEIEYYMPAGVPQLYPTSVAAPVAPESLVPPASQSNITGDFTSSGRQITVSARHLRVNQMFRRIAADFGLPVIDAEYFWFKALEEYGEAALFNTGEYLHPNLLGHQLSYHAAIDFFVEGLQRQTSQSVEAQLNGNIGINKQLPAAVLDIEVPYTATPKKSLAVRARTGTADGLGVKASGIVWHVDEVTGDLVGSAINKTNGSSIEYYRVSAVVPSGAVVAPITISKTFYGGKIEEVTSGGFNISAAVTMYTLPTTCAGKIKAHAYNSGVGRQYYEANFVCKAGVVTIATPANVGDAVVTISASGTALRLTPVAGNTNANWEIVISSGV